MKYVALLSGGKDSCFNLLHCDKNGHELVAAASLGPEPGKEELDSYLYQTVGQDAIEFVARALEVPLYRRVITGHAMELGSEYGSRDAKGGGGIAGDETEDLFALLSDVKSRHPDIQGVSVGAILSNYQRVRVEHVCRRLGLTPLCYLWNRDQGELLTEMIDAGLEAVLIKVAGIGLTTEHLGKPLAEMQPTLRKLNQLYGAHICGEGGEYESLTLNCPLFKYRIVLSEVETVIHSDNDFATVAFLRIKNAILEAKPSSEISFDLRIPPLLDDHSMPLRDAVAASQAGSTSSQIPRIVGPDHTEVLSTKVADNKKLDSWISVSNVERSVQTPIEEISIEDEVTECFHLLQASLSEHRLNISNCVNINIYISDIELFARINAVYSTFFGSSPPARACVAVDLPPPIRVRLDCVAFVECTRADRQALHVQGLSYWAPANIGPYSQAITAGERIFISGQIGLIPSRLVLPSPRSLAVETALASQHVLRVTEVLRNNSGLGWVGHTQLALYWLANVNDLPHVKTAYRSSEEFHTAPALYLVVKALPKDALFEKQVLLHTGRCEVTDEEEDGTLVVQHRQPAFQHNRRTYSDGAALDWVTSRFDTNDAGCAIICVKKGASPLLFEGIRDMKVLSPSLFSERNLSVRLFYIPSRAASFFSLAKQIFEDDEYPPTTPIPCRFISTNDVDDWDYVMCIIQS
ncbi:putative diphthamide synthase [Lyophyllum shimeji]|uniref:Diphthine--ammonia ligase n=1 Tax=Lyophyllum shimeji TaxID=47721 RepID=A0A9P3UI48_LYOSH|nr:putative diphthamide synthase [Lyophyllum shimeji]